MERITSLENSLIKRIKKLKQKKYREQEGCFLAEGIKFLDFDYLPQIIVLKEGLEKDDKLIERIEKFSCKKIVVTEKIFKEISSQETSQGVIVVYPYVEVQKDRLDDNIVVIDRVQDPGNLGTIIRIADASGFNFMILTKGSVDIYNEKTVRSSMGSIFNMNIIYMEEEELLKFLGEKEYKIIATALRNSSVEYTKMQLSSKNAIVFGSEGNGVSPKILEQASETVIIPIFGSAESLNVAVASGIILYKAREILEK